MTIFETALYSIYTPITLLGQPKNWLLIWLIEPLWLSVYKAYAGTG